MTNAPTERTIQLLLYRTFGQRAQIAVPNYTPAGWHECDFWLVTRAGYMREYEIKRSVADFRADAHKLALPKYKTAPGGGWTAIPSMAKHERLAEGDPQGPVQFWYVTPSGLLANEELPLWAGLIEVEPARLRLRIANGGRTAPRLHKTKASPAVIVHARGICCYRYWNAIRTIEARRHDRAMSLETP